MKIVKTKKHLPSYSKCVRLVVINFLCILNNVKPYRIFYKIKTYIIMYIYVYAINVYELLYACKHISQFIIPILLEKTSFLLFSAPNRSRSVVLWWAYNGVRFFICTEVDVLASCQRRSREDRYMYYTSTFVRTNGIVW